METKITLPTMDEDGGKPFAVTDWAIANGAWSSEGSYIVKGKMQKSGFGWSRVAGDSRSVKCRSWNDEGNNALGIAGDRRCVVRPRFQNPGQSGVGLNVVRDNMYLTMDGKMCYYPRTKITGDVQVIYNISLPFTSDKYLLGEENKNKSFLPEQNETYEVMVDEKMRCFATKLIGTQKSQKFCNYLDATEVKEGATEWFMLEPVPAELTADGSIQISEGILPVQFEPQNSYEARQITGGTVLNTDDFQVGRVLKDYIWNDLEKSVDVMAVFLAARKASQHIAVAAPPQACKRGKLNLNATMESDARDWLGHLRTSPVSDLFDKLYEGSIDEKGLREGLRVIATNAKERIGATDKDATKLTEEIRDAAAQYAEKKTKRSQLINAFKDVDTVINSLSF